ncbi:MAG: endolytic transglycosylase MltG [Gammaproteobacteria bacterium]
MGGLMRWLGVLVLSALAILASGAWAMHSYMNSPLLLSAPQVFQIPVGSSLSSVARDLENQGVLTRPRWFVLYGRVSGQSSRLHAGEYRLEPGLTPQDLLSRFVAGEVLLHSFTVIEGWTYRQMLAQIYAHPALKTETRELDLTEIAARLKLEQSSPEGWFLPETYRFPRGTSDLDLLAQGASAMREALQAAWAQRSGETTLEDPYQALILASIIEKETGLASEREQISGVMHRRLQRGMRLQTDPTVIYGLGESFDGNLRRADLERDTPFNTYTRKGLPPTPIALPSAAALLAAVNPAPGETLFFVASGDGDGSHVFSVTLEEHNRAVARYLKKLRAQRESRP